MTFIDGAKITKRHNGTDNTLLSIINHNVFRITASSQHSLAMHLRFGELFNNRFYHILTVESEGEITLKIGQHLAKSQKKNESGF